MENDLALEWRPVVGFPDYAIREDGVVKRTGLGIDSRTNRFVGKVMTQHRMNTPMRYFCVGLRDTDSQKHTLLVHRLVALTFVGSQPSSKHEVAHNDGNVENNHFRNLRWDTRQQNIEDRRRHGTNPVGAKNPMAKLTAVQVSDIRERVLKGERVYALAPEYGVSVATIYRIRNNEAWS